MAGYYEFKPDMYPRKIWVHIGKDIEKLKTEFDGIEIDDSVDYRGCVFDDVMRKSDKMLGVLVSFVSRKDMKVGLICHETCHIVDAIDEVLGIEHGGEASAYLAGWIAGNIDMIRMGKRDFCKV